MVRWTHIGTVVTVAFLLAASPNAEAQRPVNDRTLDQIPVPELPMLPDDGDERKILTYVRNTPAVNLDDALPRIELDQWLTATLLSYNPSAARVEWRLERCEDFTSDLPSESSELCAEAKSANISQSEEKTLTLILAVGDWRQASDGRSEWVVRPPAIRDLFMQTAADSLDIRSLSELTTAFGLPGERWPTPEFELAVNASPLRALPGETVTLKIEVRNNGKRDVPRAEITFSVFLGETPDDSKRYDYKWYPSIAAGRAVAVERLPEGRGVFSARVRAFSTRKRFKETFPGTSTFLWVHQVTDPPGLPVTVPR